MCVAYGSGLSIKPMNSLSRAVSGTGMTPIRSQQAEKHIFGFAATDVGSGNFDLCGKGNAGHDNLRKNDGAR